MRECEQRLVELELELLGAAFWTEESGFTRRKTAVDNSRQFRLSLPGRGNQIKSRGASRQRKSRRSQKAGNMKRYCKQTDIADPATIYPWILECLSRHRRRYDFRRLLLTVGGMTKQEYAAALDDGRLLQKPAEKVAAEAARQIKERRLDLPPVKIKIRKDKSSLKTREIGCEDALQQCLDYIAVYAAMPIFRRRITPCQASSMQGRGPSYGAATLSRWLRKDNAAAEYAARHGRRYHRKLQYFVKLDISKCFPSLRAEAFLSRFSRDCGNPDLVWLWQALFETHKVGEYQGFMIGALISQWAAQYIISFIYRHATSLTVARRGKRMRMVNRCLTYMDDIWLGGSSRKNLRVAADAVARYARDGFGITIKPTWQIRSIDNTPIDMMGYLIHGDGTVTVRPRIFLRVRRLALRILRKGSIALRQARRLISYKGFFRQHGELRKSMRSRKAEKKYRLRRLFGWAAWMISHYANMGAIA